MNWYVLIPRYNYYKYQVWVKTDPEVLEAVNADAYAVFKGYTLGFPFILIGLIVSLPFLIVLGLCIVMEWLRIGFDYVSNTLLRIIDWCRVNVEKAQGDDNETLWKNYHNNLTRDRHAKLKTVFPDIRPWNENDDKPWQP